jgi:hypothetical protein
MFGGSCLCGKVSYAVRGAPLAMYHCHCATCRKANGSTIATNMMVRTEEFEVTSGKELLAAFESSPGKNRYFCSACGSPIYSHGEKTRHFVSVRCGTLDVDPGVRPQAHVYVASRAPWDAICDGLPQHAEAFA